MYLFVELSVSAADEELKRQDMIMGKGVQTVQTHTVE